jgi:hypothetical protein
MWTYALGSQTSIARKILRASDDIEELERQQQILELAVAEEGLSDVAVYSRSFPVGDPTGGYGIKGFRFAVGGYQSWRGGHAIQPAYPELVVADVVSGAVLAKALGKAAVAGLSKKLAARALTETAEASGGVATRTVAESTQSTAESIVKSVDDVLPTPYRVPEELPPFDPKGSLGAARAWTIKGRLKAAHLPTTGKIRYVPPKNYSPGQPLPRGPNGGYIDRFGNEWLKGPSRTAGQQFEWDVQLGRNATPGMRALSRDGKHVNVSLDGEVTH